MKLDCTDSRSTADETTAFLSIWKVTLFQRATIFLDRTQIQPRGKIVCLRVASSSPPTRQIHLSPNVVQVVSLCPSCFSTFPQDRFICLTKLFKLSPLSKLFFNFSPRQIHLSPSVVQVVSLCLSCFSTSPQDICLTKLFKLSPLFKLFFLYSPQTDLSVSKLFCKKK